MPEKIAVIGAGIAGIAAAVRLAASGFKVDVFEKNPGPGGKMSEIRNEGFRFDTGPSLFTMPGLIEELYELAGEKKADITYNKLDVVCRYFFEDGRTIDAYSDPGRFAEELQLKAGEDPGKVLSYLEASREIFEFTYPVFIQNSLHRPKNYLKGEFIRAFFKLPKLRPFKTLHQINTKYFAHLHTIQLFDRFATYNGSNPYKTPATLMVIPHLEHNIGAFFPKEGMYHLASGLAKLAEKLGVVFHYNCEVEEILVSGQRSAVSGRRSSVSGLRTANGELRTDFSHIITDLDIYFVYKNLLKTIPFPEKWFRHERSTSALIFYWGMRIRSERLEVHNILFAQDYAQEFRCLFNLKTLHPDPSVYVFISSKTVSGDAPAGCENWFVMINVPSEYGQDWNKIIQDARWHIEEKIKRVLQIDVHKHRLFEFVLDPKGIELKTGSYRGSLYGNSSNSMWAAFQRHPNFSKVKGLYHTGGSVHPGGGIPLCLSSAKIVADMIRSQKK